MAFSDKQKRYLEGFDTSLKIVEAQAEAIEVVARLVKSSFDGNPEAVLHVFGSGHSHILSYELFHRAGGLIPIHPIFAEETMPHKGPVSVRQSERQPGFAKTVYDSADIREGEVVLIVSNSGINSYPVEFAKHCHSGGARTVAVTSLTHSKAVDVGKKERLFEVCEYVIDTGVPFGDAVVSLKNSTVGVGPLSSLMTVLVGELLVVRIAELYDDQGAEAPILKSANTPGGDEFNKRLEKRYEHRIPILKH